MAVEPLKDWRKSKQELISELEGLRNRISEMKMCEREIDLFQESYRVLNAIMQSIPEGIAVIDAEGPRIRMMSRQGAEMAGMKPEEATGPLFEFIQKFKFFQTDGSPVPIDDLPIVKALETGEVTRNREFLFERPDGSRITTLSNAAPVRDGSGNIMGAIVVCGDITERKKIEEELRYEKDKLTSIFDAMDDGVYIVDGDYNIEYVNPALIKLFGSPGDRKCYEYFHGRTEACPWCPNKRVFSGETVRWEWTSPVNERTYDIVDTPLKNPDGTVSKLEILRDITDMKAAEKELNRKESMLAQAQRIALLGNWEWDLRNNTMTGSETAYDIFSIPHGEKITFESFFELVHPVDRKMVADTFNEGLVTGRAQELDFRIITGGETKYIHGKGEVVFEDGSAVIVRGIVQDMTERKLREEEQKRLVLELKEALNKVSTLSGLLPICAACKKIRDDRGYWMNIEKFISEHSEAEFSHSICPDCEKKLYGEDATGKEG